MCRYERFLPSVELKMSLTSALVFLPRASPCNTASLSRTATASFQGVRMPTVVASSPRKPAPLPHCESNWFGGLRTPGRTTSRVGIQYESNYKTFSTNFFTLSFSFSSNLIMKLKVGRPAWWDLTSQSVLVCWKLVILFILFREFEAAEKTK